MNTTIKALVTCLAASLLLGAAAICRANSVAVVYQNIWTNGAILTTDIDPVAEKDCAKQVVQAVPDFEETTSTGTVNYAFLFWDINGIPYTTKEVKFQPICGAANTAVALYWPTGCGDPCPAATTDSVIAFSLNDAKVIADTTPIKSASAGWSGSTEVTPPSTIVPLPEIIAPPPTIGYGKFKGWEVLGSGTPISTSSSLTLKVPGEIVAALYGYPEPDPCQADRNALANAETSCVGDGLPRSACSALIASLSKALQACMATNGE
jgi:hypothetical protein